MQILKANMNKILKGLLQMFHLDHFALNRYLLLLQKIDCLSQLIFGLMQ
jgi:hypothetical protein